MDATYPMSHVRQKLQTQRTRRAFTLVELMVVIVIIGILAGMITAVAIRVRSTAKRKLVVVEMGQIELALEEYKRKHGEYPPDFSEGDKLAALRRHLSNAFPQYRGNPVDDLGQNVIDQLDPGSALVFFLGGMTLPGTNKLIGFCADQRTPFRVDNQTKGRTKPFFEFDPTRLARDDPSNPTSVLRFYPNIGPATNRAPLVYFRAKRSGGYKGKGWAAPSNFATDGVLPCLNTDVPLGDGFDWANPNRFQLICGGEDGIIGVGIGFPRGDGDPPLRYRQYRFDDITNFAGGRLEDKMP